MDKSYIAGLYDGDGSINMSKAGPKGKEGIVLKVNLCQNILELLEKVNAYFDNSGKIYKDPRECKYTSDLNYHLVFCGIKARKLLYIIRDYGVLKSQQASIALEHLNLGYFDKDEKHANMDLIKRMNKDKNSYEHPYENINDAYISGLFDAEGNVYFNTNSKGNKKSYVKITQMCCNELLENIQKYLGYGSTTERGRWKIYSKQNYEKFYDVIRETNIMKVGKLKELLDFL